MAFRHPSGDGSEVPVLSPEEAEEAELAAEFAAEEAESAARVEALRLDADARDARIGELTAMLDTATDGVVTVDDRGRILSLNKAAEALFGYDQREVTGDRISPARIGDSQTSCQGDSAASTTSVAAPAITWTAWRRSTTPQDGI